MNQTLYGPDNRSRQGREWCTTRSSMSETLKKQRAITCKPIDSTIAKSAEWHRMQRVLFARRTFFLVLFLLRVFHVRHVYTLIPMQLLIRCECCRECRVRLCKGRVDLGRFNLSVLQTIRSATREIIEYLYCRFPAPWVGLAGERKSHVIRRYSDA